MVTGSIYERKGIYYAIVSYYVDGRRKQKSVSTGLPVKGNKRRALEFLENLKRTYETKESMENMDGSRLLMTDYIDEWLKIVSLWWSEPPTKVMTIWSLLVSDPILKN